MLSFVLHLRIGQHIAFYQHCAACNYRIFRGPVLDIVVYHVTGYIGDRLKIHSYTTYMDCQVANVPILLGTEASHPPLLMAAAEKVLLLEIVDKRVSNSIHVYTYEATQTPLK